MLPDEAQVIMAKVLFFIFATCLLCIGRANAADFAKQSFKVPTEQVFQQSFHQ